jgi:hypothetical protein
MLRQTVGRRASPLPFSFFFPSYCDVSEARSYFASTVSLYTVMSAFFCDASNLCYSLNMIDRVSHSYKTSA